MRAGGSMGSTLLKYAGWAGMALLALVFMASAILLALAVRSADDSTPSGLLMVVFPFFMMADFLMRLNLQSLPCHSVRPYLLLPLSRRACVDVLILRETVGASQLVWLAFIVPYVAMTMLTGAGLWPSLLCVLTCWLAVVANTQWFVICKTLATRHVAWWLLPAVVFGVPMLAVSLADGKNVAYSLADSLVQSDIMERGNPLPLLAVLAVAVALVMIDRRVQWRAVMDEVQGDGATSGRLLSLSRLAFLDRMDGMGQWMRLEIRLILRNKNPRKQFLSASLLMVFITVSSAFSDMYSGEWNANFWCLYGYLVIGSMTLQNLMNYEGNYIDGLMVHREHLLAIFQSKYRLYCALLLVPLLLMLPTVIMGKWSLYMLLSYGVFTAGFQYFLLFQMAAYNDVTMPLNAKFTGKAGLKTDYRKAFIMLAAYLGPVLLLNLMRGMVGGTATYTLALVTGLVFVATHPLWLRATYRRVMARKYEQMENLRNSRG